MKKFQNDISLFDPIGNDRDGNEITMLDIITKETDDYADTIHLKQETKLMYEAVFSVLNQRERTVIRLRYGLGYAETFTQQQIASFLGISRSYVSRIEKKALQKLHAALQEPQG